MRWRSLSSSARFSAAAAAGVERWHPESRDTAARAAASVRRAVTFLRIARAAGAAEAFGGYARRMMFARPKGGSAWVVRPAMLLLLCGTLGGQRLSAQNEAQSAMVLPDDPGSAMQQAGQGTVSGMVTDADNAGIPGAKVQLSIESSAEKRDVTADSEGRFTFANVPAGRFTVRVTAAGMAQGGGSGVLKPGQQMELPAVVLRAGTNVEVMVTPKSTEEVAELEVKAAEQQRLYGFAPNFYVSYRFDAPPLTKGQKWSLAYKTMLDPMTFVIAGGFAGIQQATNAYPGFGEGAQGYGKRYGSTYANIAIGTTLGGYVFPVLFKQDPRYFYKGTGTVKKRALYALSTAFIARGDNGKWQPAWGEFAADFAAGGLSNLYYAKSDRQGATLTVENSLIAIGFTGVSNLLQEFVLRRLSTHAHH